MEAEKTLIKEKMLEWDRLLDDYHLPGWDAFPLLPLYMDQVVYLINQYLSPQPEEELKQVTPAMINNYVKLGIIPRPIKKRYSRTHLAYLIIVCTLKQTISTAEIKKLVPASLGEEEIKTLYEDYISIFDTGKTTFRKNMRDAAAPVFKADGPTVTRFVFQAGVTSILSQILAKQVLSLYPEAEEQN